MANIDKFWEFVNRWMGKKFFALIVGGGFMVSFMNSALLFLGEAMVKVKDEPARVDALIAHQVMLVCVFLLSFSLLIGLTALGQGIGDNGKVNGNGAVKRPTI